VSLKFITCDVIKAAKEDSRGAIIAQGVNCQRAMGSGVALSIMTEWPIVREQYMETEPHLGKVDYIRVIVDELPSGDTSMLVANCYTQTEYGYDGKRYGNLEAVRISLSEVFELSSKSGMPVYMPRIGCGLAGLDWNTEVLPVVEKLLVNTPGLHVYVCTL